MMNSAGWHMINSKYKCTLYCSRVAPNGLSGLGIPALELVFNPSFLDCGRG